MTYAIEISELSFAYPGSDEESISDVSLTIEAGDVVAVVGGNGSGKTTLCKTFNGLIPHYWSGGFAGTVLVGGVDTTEVSVARLAHSVGYVYQDFGNQLVRATVGDEVSFGPINFGLVDHRERTEEAMRALGIEHLRDQFVWQLSGGQQHLVALASVLALRPDVIVVDEPVAELDPVHAEQVYEHLLELNRTRGTTIVVIEHHAEFVARYCRSVILMAQGRLQWHLPVREALARRDELSSHGIPAPQIVQAIAALDHGELIALDVDEAETRIRGAGWSTVPPSPLTRRATTRHRSPEDDEPSAIVAELRDVRFGYTTVTGGRTRTLDGLDLELRDSERVALVGSNGAGKSTLMRLLTGLKVPISGEVVVNGINTRTTSAAHLASHVSYLNQRPEQMFLTDSVRGDIAMFPSGRRREGWETLVDRVIDRVSLGEVADRDGRMLSGGQQRRATLGIGLAMTPTLLLLDEPTSSLDLATRDVVTAMLGELADRIRCVVVATHDMHLVADWADRVVVLGAGRVIADLTPAELFDDVELLASALLVPPQITQLGRRLGMSPPPLTVEEFATRMERLGRPARSDALVDAAPGAGA